MKHGVLWICITFSSCEDEVREQPARSSSSVALTARTPYAQVKSQFGDQPKIYNQFLGIMEESSKPMLSAGSAILITDCVFIIALWASIALLSWGQTVIIPFLFAMFLMYLLDPVVNTLIKTPKGCWTKLTSGPRFQKFTLIRSPVRGRVARDGSGRALAAGPAIDQPLLPWARAASPFQDEIGKCTQLLRTVRLPRYMAVLLTIVFAVGVILLLFEIIISSVKQLQNNFARYEVGAEELERNLSVYFHYLNISYTQTVRPYLSDVLESLGGTLLSYVLDMAEKTAIAVGAWGLVKLQL
jgi:hypothetical protein